jgi:hypothetical protein
MGIKLVSKEGGGAHITKDTLVKALPFFSRKEEQHVFRFRRNKGF